MKEEEILMNVLPFFPNAFIYKNEEIIIEPKNNIYFRIDNISKKEDLDCKILEWCSRSAVKGVSNYWQKYMLRGINSYFGKNFSKEEMSLIYTMLGNNINRKLCVLFIESGFDLKVLEKKG